jgi:hypothetical protein
VSVALRKLTWNNLGEGGASFRSQTFRAGRTASHRALGSSSFRRSLCLTFSPLGVLETRASNSSINPVLRAAGPPRKSDHGAQSISQRVPSSRGRQELTGGADKRSVLPIIYSATCSSTMTSTLGISAARSRLVCSTISAKR